MTAEQVLELTVRAPELARTANLASAEPP